MGQSFTIFSRSSGGNESLSKIDDSIDSLHPSNSDLKSEDVSVFEDLKRVLETVHPYEKELNKRPLPWPSTESQNFGTRYETGVDCDFVFQGTLLIGNL